MASLKLIHHGALSLCSWRRSGVTWSNFDYEKTSRAAEFITDCKRFRGWTEIPTSTAFPWSNLDNTRQDTSDCRTRPETDRRMLRSRRSTAKHAVLTTLDFICTYVSMKIPRSRTHWCDLVIYHTERLLWQLKKVTPGWYPNDFYLAGVQLEPTWPQPAGDTVNAFWNTVL